MQQLHQTLADRHTTAALFAGIAPMVARKAVAD